MTWRLLDTDAVADFLNGFASTVDLVNELYSRGDVLCTCGVVITEVFAGLRPVDRYRGDELFESMMFLPETPESAWQAGIWRHEFARLGRQLATADCLIAAIAYEHDATLLTGNINHFPMDEVRLLPIPRRPSR